MAVPLLPRPAWPRSASTRRGGRGGSRLRLHGGRCAVPLAVLFARPGELGAGRAVLVRVLRDLGASGFPRDVLLLPKAYYRAFFLSPPACAVRRPRRAAIAARAAFPYVLMNAHRYFLYLATVVLGFLWYDAVRAFFFDDGSLIRRRRRLAGAARQRRPACRCSRSAATRSGIWSAAGSTASRCSAAARTRHRLWRGVERAQRPAHAVGVDQPRLGRRSPTSTSGSRRAASSTTRGSSEWTSSATTTTWS